MLLYKDTSHIFEFFEYEMFAGVMYNQTIIKKTIQSFLYKNQLRDIPGIVVFANDLLQEQLVCEDDLHIDLASRVHVKSAFGPTLNYLAMLEPGLLFQYQILFWQIAVYIEMFTAFNLLHIKNLLNFTDGPLSCANNLDQLHLVAKANSSDLYVKIMQTIEQINNA